MDAPLLAGIGEGIGRVITASAKAIDTVFPGEAIASKQRAARKGIRKSIALWKEIDSEDLPQHLKNYLVRKAENITNIADIACSIPIENPQNASRIQDDWKQTFYSSASLCSDRDLQKLWSEILASEIDTPGTTSKRTMQFLSSLSTKEAREFQVFCLNVIILTGASSTATWTVPTHFFNDNLDAFHHFQEISLFRTEPDIFTASFGISENTEQGLIIDGSPATLFNTSKNNYPLSIRAIYPSQVAKELSLLCPLGTNPELPQLLTESREGLSLSRNRSKAA